MFGNWWMGFATRNQVTYPAFAPYLREGRLQPRVMTPDALLTLIAEVAKLGLERELLQPVA